MAIPEVPASPSDRSPPPEPASLPFMTADEVNFLVYSYLRDAGYQHSSYSFLHEAELIPQKSLKTVPSGLLNMSIPPGHLVRILQKGLQFLEAEARFRGEDIVAHPVRLVGYDIPDPPAEPIIPKSLPRFPTPSRQSSPAQTIQFEKGQGEMLPPPLPSHATQSLTVGQSQLPTQSVKDKPSSAPASRSRRESISSLVGSKRKVRSRAASGETEDESEVTTTGGSRRDKDRTKRKKVENSEKEKEKNKERRKRTTGSTGRPTPPLAPGSATVKKGGKDKRSGKSDDEDSKRDVKDPRPIAKMSITDKERVISLVDSFSSQLKNGQWNPAAPDLFVAGGADDQVRTWHIPDPGDGMETEISSTAKFKMGGTSRTTVTTLQWNKEGTLIACGRKDGCVSLHTAEGGYFHVYMLFTGYAVTALKWNSTGSCILTGGDDGNIYLADVTNDPRPGTKQYSSRIVGDAVLDLEFCTDNFFFAAIDKDINLFNVSKSAPVRRFKGHTEDVNVVVIDPTRQYLVSGSDDHSVRIWSLCKITELNPNNGSSAPQVEENFVDRKGGVIELKHEGEIQDIVWVKIDGQPHVVSLSLDQTCKIWNVENGTCAKSLKVGGESWRDIAISPSDRLYVALPLDNRVIGIYRIADGELLLEYENSGDICGAYWHPTRPQIALIGYKDDTVVVDISQLYSMKV